MLAAYDSGLAGRRVILRDYRRPHLLPRTLASTRIARALLVLFHLLDEALGPHIGPMLLDVREARLAGLLSVGHSPAVGNVREGWPERILPLVIDQGKITAIFVFKWIRLHDLVLS